MEKLILPPEVITQMKAFYQEKHDSIPSIARATGLKLSTVRLTLIRNGVKLRSRADGVRLAAGVISEKQRGKKKGAQSERHRQNISESRQEWAKKHARGTSLKPNGYVEFTNGPHKSKSVHRVLMETHVGRKLKTDEHVHHIDGNRANNELSNLQLMSAAEHAKLHRQKEHHAKS
jgi:hypothetical protein